MKIIWIVFTKDGWPELRTIFGSSKGNIETRDIGLQIERVEKAAIDRWFECYIIHQGINGHQSGILYRTFRTSIDHWFPQHRWWIEWTERFQLPSIEDTCERAVQAVYHPVGKPKRSWHAYRVWNDHRWILTTSALIRRSVIVSHRNSNANRVRANV